MFLRFLTMACTAVIVSAAALAAPVMDPATADLGRKLEAGSEHRYGLIIDSSMALNSPDMPGLEQKQKVNQAIDFVMTVKEVNPETGATLELKYEALKFTIDSANFTGEFDSAKPAAEDGESEAAPALRPVIGTVLTVKVDPKGKVTEVTGGDELGGLGLWGQVAAQFRERGIVASFIEPVLNTYNEKGEAAVGETWTHSDTLEDSPLGSFRIVTDHTLDSIKDGEAHVKLAGKIEALPAKEEETDQPPAFEIKESSNGGEYVWDTEAGILKTLKQSQAVSMKTSMQGMSMNIDNTTTIQLTRK